MALIVNAATGYMNARVRGMRSTLLSRSDLEALLDRGHAHGMTELLLTSTYEHEAADSLTHLQGADAVEDAVTRNLINTFVKLRRIASGRSEELVEIFLTRWDLNAVKSLLRIRHHELDAHTGGDSLAPGPNMPMSLLNELAAQDSMASLVRGLAGWNSGLCRRLTGALAKYEEARELRILEEVLDRSYFVENARVLEKRSDLPSQFILDLLRMEIDRINLRMLFAPRPEGMMAEDVLAWLLPRGYIASGFLREIASAGPPDRAAGLLDRTPYASLESGLTHLAETGRFSRLDRQFEQLFSDRLRRGVRKQSIGLAVFFLFAWQKHNEVTKIRMLARGHSANLPKAYLREEVLGG